MSVFFLLLELFHDNLDFLQVYPFLHIPATGHI
jgi:hypothetical protein